LIARALQRARDEIALVGVGRVMAGAVGVGVAVVVLWWLLRPAPEPIEARLPFAAPVTSLVDESRPTTSPDGTIVVHVVGAVTRPGLVNLDPHARVADALAAAGGPTTDAQVHALNLAARVHDGLRLYVPSIAEADVGEHATNGATDVAGSLGGGAMVDVNRATVQELQVLPGVGPAIAAAIVTHRERRGPFTSVDALLDVTGIGPAKLEGIREFVRV
jgi:competence protein ComEA